MTDLTYNCLECEDTGKVQERVWNGHGFVNEEVDCVCVIERIEEARGEMLMELERGN